MRGNFIPPNIDDPSVSRAIRELYSKVEELYELLAKSEHPTDTGSEGEIRVLALGDNKYRIAIRHRDGWLISSDTEFTFRDRST